MTGHRADRQVRAAQSANRDLRLPKVAASRGTLGHWRTNIVTLFVGRKRAKIDLYISGSECGQNGRFDAICEAALPASPAYP